MTYAVSKCTENDVAAEDIINSNGILLLAKDTFLNGYIKEKLVEMGILHIRIYNTDIERSKVEDSTLLKYVTSYKESVISVKQIINGILCGEKLDYDKAVEISKLIYDSMQGCGYIKKCMNEIHGADEYTYNHCVNTAFYSMLIGKWLGLPTSEIQKLILSGLLHDIGKTKIPKEILNKNGKLTNEEFELIKKHTVYGYDILNQIDEIDLEVRRAVLFHHERIDRSGYPFKVSSDTIGLYAKIVAIADVYDAMTSERVYRKRVTPFETFEMFKTIGIGLFDTVILNTFLRNISKYYIGAKVALSSGERGRIVYIPPHDILCPIVKIGSGYVDLSKKGSLKVINME